ncbi:LysR family transcriptional regulator [Comamonas sp. CMM01]|uniref:LysR family transcriptional regulator n=1 Tax=Comamonas sp. CMM01 TaxID=2769280 RepID=UPI001CE04752|nr:LysR family transcriptional regulator [Comamonas sp. CMM01]
MTLRLHARALLYFDAIRKAGSIREAARRLHVASSAVNRQLLELEDQIGAPLFERLPAGLQLTAAGEVVARHVIVVLQDAHRVDSELDALRGIRRGEVSLQAVEGLNADFLPQVLAQMAQHYPGVRVTTRSSGSASMAAAVAMGEADVAVGFALPRHAELTQLAMGRFDLGAVVTPAHPLAGRAAVSLSDCAAYPLLLPGAELSVRWLLQPWLDRLAGQLHVPLESASIDLMRTLARDGVGVAFQTRLGLERELAAGQLVFVPLRTPGVLVSELGVYVRAGRALAPALDAFVRLLTEAVARAQAVETAQGAHLR